MSLAVSVLAAGMMTAGVTAGEAETRAYFQKVRHEPALLRSFLYAFPKGGELHNHLDGAIYAESYIRWAAEDGKCIDLESLHDHRRRPVVLTPSGPPSAGSATTATW